VCAGQRVYSHEDSEMFLCPLVVPLHVASVSKSYLLNMFERVHPLL